MWSEGRLTVDHLQGYSKEYFQLVKAVPAFVQNIASANTDSARAPNIEENLKEESEHIEPWARFAGAMGVSQSELAGYAGAAKTNDAVAKMMSLTSLSFEEAVAAMYAFEAELPKISRSKIDGLVKFYSMTGNKDALNYFEIHEEADVRHAQVWRGMLAAMPAEKREKAFAAAVESLKAQNLLLDSVQEKYVGSMYC
jgi:pyrroloquinoline-quinone synthase